MDTLGKIDALKIRGDFDPGGSQSGAAWQKLAIRRRDRITLGNCIRGVTGREGWTSDQSGPVSN